MDQVKSPVRRAAAYIAITGSFFFAANANAFDITQNTDTTTVLGAGSCSSSGDAHFMRRFPLNAEFGITGKFSVTNVHFGVAFTQSDGPTQPVEVHLYRISSFAPLAFANLTEIGNTTLNVAPAVAPFFLDAAATGAVPDASVQDLVVDIVSPNGKADGYQLGIGLNAAGESAPNYFAGAACGLTEPTVTDPDHDFVMVVSGTENDCVDPPANLLSWHRGEADAKDSKGSNDGTLVGDTTYAPGKVGEAFSFDGSGDRVDIGNVAGLTLTGSAVTLDAWIKPAVSDWNGVIVGKTASGFNDYLLYLNGGYLTGGIKAGGTEIFVGSVKPIPGLWSHVALTYDGSAVKTYINGALIDNAAKTGNIDGTTSPVEIGGRQFDNLDFKGVIDEVEIFDRALSGTEIAGIYNAGSDGKCSIPTMDFGDAPASYPVYLSQDGARHTIGALRLGTTIDGEVNGQPNAIASGDDLSDVGDETGAVFSNLAADGIANLNAVVTGGSGKLDVWIDVDADGSWNEAGDKVLSGVAVVPGINVLHFHLPSTAHVGDTFARVRLSSAGTALPTGAAPDGEVEDYMITVGPDVTPDPFSFVPRINVPLNTYITSNTVTIKGLADSASMSIVGGTFSVGCNGTFVAGPAQVGNGTTVCVRVKSASTRSTTTGATLTVGSASVPFTVTTIPPPPVVTLKASPTTVSKGGSTTLTWTSKGANTCSGVYGTASWATPKPLNGTTSSGPINGVNGSKPFRLTCQNAGGLVNATVNITVR